MISMYASLLLSLFSRFLTQLKGTVVVIFGVIGIVAFGSINSGLNEATDVAHITHLWRRGGWLAYFFPMAFALISLLIFTSRLDFVLASRADLAPVPFSAAHHPSPNIPISSKRPRSWLRAIIAIFVSIIYFWNRLINWLTGRLELWVAPKDDTQIAWTLGIAWAACGGGLAGGCLVFAKATYVKCLFRHPFPNFIFFSVKLLSGSLSHQNPGNQFGHAAPIFTILLLVITAVLQIICLNRGLKVYDSTLVVPVFYGVYTATGWLDSLIFNGQVEAYKSWTLFLIFVSILVLISGVVLLTHKKPEPVTATPRPRRPKSARPQNGNDEELGQGEDQVLWAVGDVTDEDDNEGEDEDIDHHQHPLHHHTLPSKLASSSSHRGLGEQSRLIGEPESPRRSMDPFKDDHELNNLTTT